MNDEELYRKMVQEVTDDFVGLFADDVATYDGIFGRMVVVLGLPDGVDPEDPRVVEIVARCREKHAE
jgi:hypothetical protein